MWLTNLPVSNLATMMLESSPPLMINDLFIEHVTHSTAAMCSLYRMEKMQQIKTLARVAANSRRRPVSKSDKRRVNTTSGTL